MRDRAHKWPVPNAHGVYQPCMSITLPMPRANWQGVPLAEINIVHLPEGWLHAISWVVNDSGHGEPLSASRTGRIHPTEAETLSHAVRRLRAAVKGKEGREADLIVKWLDTIDPVQGSLF